jgi:hypothetical protein
LRIRRQQEQFPDVNFHIATTIILNASGKFGILFNLQSKSTDDVRAQVSKTPKSFGSDFHESSARPHIDHFCASTAQNNRFRESAATADSRKHRIDAQRIRDDPPALS